MPWMASHIVHTLQSIDSINQDWWKTTCHESIGNFTSSNKSTWKIDRYPPIYIHISHSAQLLLELFHFLFAKIRRSFSLLFEESFSVSFVALILTRCRLDCWRMLSASDIVSSMNSNGKWSTKNRYSFHGTAFDFLLVLWILCVVCVVPRKFTK